MNPFIIETLNSPPKSPGILKKSTTLATIREVSHLVASFTQNAHSLVLAIDAKHKSVLSEYDALEVRMEQTVKDYRTAPDSTAADKSLILVTQNQTLMQQQSLMLSHYREACNRLTLQQQTIDNLKDRIEALESNIQAPISNCGNKIKLSDRIVNARDYDNIKCRSFQESPLITKVANLGPQKRTDSIMLANLKDDSWLDYNNENSLIDGENSECESIKDEIMIWDEPFTKNLSMKHMAFQRKDIMIKAIAQNLGGTGYILHGNILMLINYRKS
jgi:hypothetical protein